MNPDEKYIPDATATNKDGTSHIFEVETSDTITGEHSENQWKMFSAHAKANNGVFVVFVQDDYEDEARKQVRELGITAQVW